MCVGVEFLYIFFVVLLRVLVSYSEVLTGASIVCVVGIVSYSCYKSIMEY